jgi:hypothetical protein
MMIFVKKLKLVREHWREGWWSTRLWVIERKAGFGNVLHDSDGSWDEAE